MKTKYRQAKKNLTKELKRVLRALDEHPLSASYNSNYKYILQELVELKRNKK